MYKKCEEILKELENENKIKVWWDFKFPEKEELKLRLKDILETEVDERYYLSDEQVEKIKQNNINNKQNFEHIENNQSKTAYSRNFGSKGKLQKDICDTLQAAMGCGGGNIPIVEEIKIIQVAQMYGIEKEPNPQAGRIYDSEGISPTMDSCSGGNRMPKILVREATKKGYAEATEGDSINLEQLNSKTRRGRVGKKVAQTLTTIRKLTPRECWRLMRFSRRRYR